MPKTKPEKLVEKWHNNLTVKSNLTI